MTLAEALTEKQSMMVRSRNGQTFDYHRRLFLEANRVVSYKVCTHRGDSTLGDSIRYVDDDCDCSNGMDHCGRNKGG